MITWLLLILDVDSQCTIILVVVLTLTYFIVVPDISGANPLALIMYFLRYRLLFNFTFSSDVHDMVRCYDINFSTNKCCLDLIDLN